jgi:hypothetical protein
LKWGLAPVSAGAVIDALHIAVEALRNSFGSLHEHLGRFVVSHLRFDAEPGDVEEAASLWRFLSGDADQIETLAEMNIHWSDGRLHVGSHYAETADFHSKVTGLISFFMTWRKATDTRWASIGECCRRLLATLVISVDGLLAGTMGDEQVCKYHLNGYSRLSSDVRRFCIVACSVPYAVDGFCAR